MFKEAVIEWGGKIPAPRWIQPPAKIPRPHFMPIKRDFPFDGDKKRWNDAENPHLPSRKKRHLQKKKQRTEKYRFCRLKRN
ncbi:hypothetical protein NPIL_216261 [Nephila pilipes]|uniref:Uncharacterized protein n=1 Tax=Nephila pilipes TaxID=299642 RepID=A0A8X6NES8_NEPPI|nr:hypothetical protein NPIL_216261 [Nephila pilipes]